MTVLSVYFERVISHDVSSSNKLLEKAVEQRKQRERSTTNNAPDVVSFLYYMCILSLCNLSTEILFKYYHL